VSRRSVRFLFAAVLLAASAFAAWSWFRPYARETDPAARGEISETLVTRDQSFFWINVHYHVAPGMTHDLQTPVFLTAGDGRNFDPADTTFAGNDPKITTEIWFKFWLDPSDLSSPLTLHINGGNLTVKANFGLPSLGASGSRNFTTNHW
jgi:hypothetical protein